MVQVEPAPDAGSPSSHRLGSGLMTATGPVDGGIIGAGVFDRATSQSPDGPITLLPVVLRTVGARTPAVLPVDRRVER